MSAPITPETLFDPAAPAPEPEAIVAVVGAALGADIPPAAAPGVVANVHLLRRHLGVLRGAAAG